MKKTGFAWVALVLLELISTGQAWADRVGPRGHHHTHNPGFALGLGVLSGYGFGYYGRAPYFPPYYRHGPGYGVGLYGYGYPSYGFVPWYGFTPGYAYPPVVAVPSAPPVYIQQPAAPQPQSSSNYYWHYCPNPEGYYPYVKNCPGGWLQVSPKPDQ